MSCSAQWEQAETRLVARVASLFRDNWTLIDAMIAANVGTHLTRSHALRLARKAIEALEAEEAAKL